MLGVWQYIRLGVNYVFVSINNIHTQNVIFAKLTK